MDITAPIEFQDAIQALADKGLLPTELSSAELQQHVSDDLRARAFFSARVLNADLLQQFRDQVADIVSGKIDQATARMNLKQILDSMNYDPAHPADISAKAGTPGELTDLGSNARLNLVLNHNTTAVRGFGAMQQGQRPGALAAFPAQQLVRISSRQVPRNWKQIWDDAVDELGDETSATSAAQGMVALKGDPIWSEISAFGTPYPPFDFNSGMGLRPVARSRAIALGVLKPDQKVKPSTVSMNGGLQASNDLDSDLAKGLSDAVHIVGNILKFKNRHQRDQRDAGLSSLRTFLVNFNQLLEAA